MSTGSVRSDFTRARFSAMTRAKPGRSPCASACAVGSSTRWSNSGGRWSARLRFDAAIAAYQRGLEVDPIVEPFYQGLMRCYQHMGRDSEAISAYRRLRQVLSITLSLKPSAASERLYLSLRDEA